MNPSLLKKAFLDDLAKKLAVVLFKVSSEVREGARHLIREAFEASPEYREFFGGVLQGELGLRNPLPAMEQVLAGIQSGLDVAVTGPTVRGEILEAVLTVRFLRTDLKEVLTVPLGTFVSEKGHKVSWLDWLLTGGEAVVIDDYWFRSGPYETSRTGLGLMFRGQGRGWRVPQEFAGTLRDNWLTRAFASMGPAAESLMVASFRRHW